jgi:acylaminoacyl-peptidase
MATTRRGAPRSTKPFRPRDLLKQVMIQDLAVAPDGSSVVYGRRIIEGNAYRKSLWRTTFRGGRPDRLTSADGVDTRPRFSPDGSSLLFLSDRSGRSQPWLLPLSGGEPRLLADVPGDVSAAEWSPDGRTVLLLAPSGQQRFIVGDEESPTARRIADYTWRMDSSGFRDQWTSLWTVPAAGGRPRRLTAPAFDVNQAFWDPTGTRIGFVADIEPGVLEEYPQVWSLPARGGKPRREAAIEGMVFTASWSRAGALAFIGNARATAPEWANADLFVAVGDDVRQLGADLDTWIACTSYGDMLDPEAAFQATSAWIDDRTVVASVAWRGGTLPYAFGLDGTVEQLAAADDAVVTSLATGAGRIAAIASVGGPAEVYAVEDGALRPLTRDGSRWFGPFRRTPERIAVLHPDGHEIDGWVLPARGSRRRGPTVLVVHGGPHASFPPVPWMEMLALSDAGLHVLWCNPRGSTSYGEKYAQIVDGTWGDPDSDDQLRVVDWGVRRGLVDRAHVGIMGLSYGGFMTNWMLGHHPGVFAAGLSENPVTDMIGEYGNSDFGRSIGRLASGEENPWEHPQAFLRRSPYTEIHRNEAPVLYLQAEQDQRCPPAQSELPFTILRSLGRTVEMVRYPDESHTMLIGGRPDRRVDRLERAVDWFSRHLGTSTRRGSAARPAGGLSRQRSNR